jgi:alkylation response protein AidB-like acyl-CoA dehydrogenase
MDTEKGHKARKFCAMAKFTASDTAMKVTTDAVQVMGGYGYMKDFPAERMMRDAKLIQIYTGTNQIMRLVAAREIFRE